MTASPTSSATEDAASLFALPDPTDAMRTMFEMQRLQFATVLAWQEAVATWTNEMVDIWTSRFGGGAPIDA